MRTLNTMGVILYLAPVPAEQIIHPDHLSQQFVRKQARWPPIFSQVFAKNSLIKNIFEEEKSLIVEHDFFGENSFVLFIGSKYIQRAL